MGILGPIGTHSEAAARYLNSKLEDQFDLKIFPTIDEAISNVAEGLIDSAFVPVENSLEGSVNITLDTLARLDDLKIVRELVWSVHNSMMIKPNCQSIKKVFSHPQALSQCREFIRKNLPDAEIVATSSTSKAAEIVGKSSVDDGFAAICTQRAGELNSLIEFAREIQDNSSNSTRFFQIARKDFESIEDPNLPSKILIICQLDGKSSGALCNVLEEFAHRNVNLTRIESRPAKTELGTYIFFFDLEMNAPENRSRELHRMLIEESILAVSRKTLWLKNLGEFPVIIAKN